MALEKPNLLRGDWRIVWMAGWAQDFVDLEGPGRITFGADRLGSFRFGAVQAELDWRIDGTQPASERVEFSWDGVDEGDEVSGRGHAEIVNGELHGHLYFHLGDDSAFRATRHKTPPKKRARSA